MYKKPVTYVTKILLFLQAVTELIYGQTAETILTENTSSATMSMMPT